VYAIGRSCALKFKFIPLADVFFYSHFLFRATLKSLPFPLSTVVRLQPYSFQKKKSCEVFLLVEVNKKRGWRIWLDGFWLWLIRNFFQEIQIHQEYFLRPVMNHCSVIQCIFWRTPLYPISPNKKKWISTRSSFFKWNYVMSRVQKYCN